MSIFSKSEWEYEEGPRGGDRWRNPDTDEIRYEKPAGAEDPPESDEQLVGEGDEVEVEYYSPGSGEDSISGTVESVTDSSIEVSTVYGTESINRDFINDLDIEGESGEPSESGTEDDEDGDGDGEDTEVLDPNSSQEPSGEPMSSVSTDDISEDFDLSSSEREVVANMVDSAIEQYDVDLHSIELDEETLSAGFYRHDERSIHLNPRHFNSESTQEWNENDHLATDSVEGLVSHELTHAIHFQDGPVYQLVELDEWQNDEHKEMAGKISGYAQESPIEFIAEVGSMKLLGEDIPEDVEMVYNGYVGPDLEELEL